MIFAASEAVTTGGREILTVPDWSQVTFTTNSSGIRISHRSGSDGLIVPVGVVVTLILGPNDRVYGSGTNGDVISFTIQPLPWIARTILGAAKALGF